MVLVVGLLPISSLLASQAANAIGKGRAQIAAGDCRGAIETLQRALPPAVDIAARKERGDALAAIRFYSAVAFTDCGMTDNARVELREFFRVKPGKSAIDHARYSAAFVAVFEEVQRSTGDTFSFEAIYPGFNEYAQFADEGKPIKLWGTSPEFQILAEEEERNGWGLAADPLAQSEFIQRFWARRDTDPATERNEFRDQTRRRVTFADQAFRTADEERGSFTDRGKVFVLLGPPARLHRQGLQRFETTIVGRRSRTPLTGTLERWVYFRPQLPGVVPAQQVEFRFITHPGYGEAVMQKEFMALKALAVARKAYFERTVRVE